MSKRTMPALVFSVICMLILVASPANANVKQSIAETAKKYTGVPYQWGGASPTGFDCSGFIYYVFQQNGITLPRTANSQYHAGESISQENLKVGDLVFFETYKPGPSHSGIYVGNNQFIHASSSNGISISSINDPYYWAPKYLGAKRMLDAPKQKVLAALSEGDYHDIPEDHWAHDAIHEMSLAGIISGTDQSLFEPNLEVNRAQAAVMIAKALELDTSNANPNFSDMVEGHWATGAAHAVVAAGYMRTFDQNTFGPNEILTREKLASLFDRVFELKSAEESQKQFADVDPSDRTFAAIQRLTASGITSGYSDDTYRPNEEVTRAQFSVFLYRALNL